MGDERRALAGAWVAEVVGRGAAIEPLAGDASFRRYFRVCRGGERWVLMDAPPDREPVAPFLAVRAWFESAGLRVSHLIAADVERGLLLLEDLGDVTWASHARDGGDLTPLFADALRQLHLLQSSTPDFALPHFDAARMRRECDLYLDWYLPHVAGHEPTPAERAAFHETLSPLLDRLAAFPHVPVHLDFHSRNLMLPEGHPPLAHIDYQDAVLGPVTYDLASLLYDCYRDYPERLRRDWSRRFFAELPAAVAARFGDFEAWHEAVRLTALQRHVKAIGIFARLAFRDGKRQFLDEIPLTRAHLCDELDVWNPDGAGLDLLRREPAA